MNRLALYVYYHPRGELSSHARYFLESLKEVATERWIIVNGKLRDADHAQLTSLGCKVLLRTNQGFDFGAWKDALAKIGEERLSQFDEIILCNSSIYGPIRPWTDVFADMAARPNGCDFWGLYRHQALEGLFPEHLQSYFLVLKQRLITSDAFRTFWRTLKPARNWQEAVNHEVHFTEYFEQAGFKSDALVHFTAHLIYPNPTIAEPIALLEEGFPVLKRKVFSEGYSSLLDFTSGNNGPEVLAYLQKRGNYPVDLILADLLETMQASALQRALHLTFALPDTATMASAVGMTPSDSSVAAILFSNREDRIAYNLAHLNNLPETARVIVVASTEVLAARWKALASELAPRCLTVKAAAQTPSDGYTHWLQCRDVFESTNYVCVIHDKKAHVIDLPIIDRLWHEHGLLSLLASRSYVQEVIRTLDNNPRLGLLTPTMPTFSVFPHLITNNEWGKYLTTAKQLVQAMGLQVPFDQAPRAPLGSMFWVRGRAMAALYRHPWTIEKDANNTADNVHQALERLYPMIVQESGFLTATVIPLSRVGVTLDNLSEAHRFIKIAKRPESVLVSSSELKAVLRGYIRYKQEQIRAWWNKHLSR